MTSDADIGFSCVCCPLPSREESAIKFWLRCPIQFLDPLKPCTQKSCNCTVRIQGFLFPSICLRMLLRNCHGLVVRNWLGQLQSKHLVECWNLLLGLHYRLECMCMTGCLRSSSHGFFPVTWWGWWSFNGGLDHHSLDTSEQFMSLCQCESYLRKGLHHFHTCPLYTCRSIISVSSYCVTSSLNLFGFSIIPIVEYWWYLSHILPWNLVGSW